MEQGDYFFYKGKLIKDVGLSINAKHIFEALTTYSGDETLSVRLLAEDLGFAWEKAYSGVLELITVEFINYNLEKDFITIKE